MGKVQKTLLQIISVSVVMSVHPFARLSASHNTQTTVQISLKLGKAGVNLYVVDPF
jgi:hypothetical protein